MTSRERFAAALSRRIPDRVPMTEISYWPDTVTRWRREGLPDGVEPLDYFKLERICVQCPINGSLRLAEQVIEETETHRVVKDNNGVTHKSWKNHYAPPVEMDFLIKTFDDWKRHRERLADMTGRVAADADEQYRKAVQSDDLRVISPTEPVWYILRTLGFENALVSIAREPDFIDDMMKTYTDFVLDLLREALRRGYRYDAVWFFSDLCYKNGMLFSPRTYRERFQAHHARIKAFCREQGMLLMLHCDGDVREFIPLLIETGFDCIQPLEARAGNDVRQLKRQHGAAICFFGNINMDVLARGDRSEIEDEVAGKVEAAKAGGGYIWHSDHSVPPTVSFDSYALACETGRKHGRY